MNSYSNRDQNACQSLRNRRWLKDVIHSTPDELIDKITPVLKTLIAVF